VLIDGRRFHDAYEGMPILPCCRRTPSKRIEVLRGPYLHYIGSNAMAGVISIITKNGDYDPYTSMEAAVEPIILTTPNCPMDGEKVPVDYFLTGSRLYKRIYE